MKKIHNVKRCARCNTLFGRNETINTEKSLCALCDQMHSEAMEIYAQRIQALGKTVQLQAN